MDPTAQQATPATLLTVHDVAHALNVSPRFVRYQTSAGKLRATRFSERCVRYTAAEVERYVASATAEEPQR